MVYNRIITENQLDQWVRDHSIEAQGIIVELVFRLIAVSSPKPKNRRFPLGDSIGQPGPDGILDTDFDFEPFVPEGQSFWEIGTGLKAGIKASSDYDDLVKMVEFPEAIRKESTFVFVTPLSGRRGWSFTWKPDAQQAWLDERRKRNDWRDVRIIDGTKLIDWLQHFPGVEHWLAGQMHLATHQIETPEERWNTLRTIGSPPPLIPSVFLVNRDIAVTKLRDVFLGVIPRLRLDTHLSHQAANFVAAYVANLDDNEKLDFIGRCLILSGIEAWDSIISINEPQILIADFNLDDADEFGTRQLEKALRRGHKVIFAGQPGGIPHSNRVNLPKPSGDQIRKALENAGYKEERARILGQKSNGDINFLLNCLQGLSTMPEWAQDSAAADLAIAIILGSWNDQNEADRGVVEELSGNSYGEWIGKMHNVALQPGTPLTQRENVWKFSARYEGWYALGPRVFDDNLKKFREVTVKVLRERDPKFELPPEDRFAAVVHGKKLLYSKSLRNGLTESLALLGSHSGPFTSCSTEMAEGTAVGAVRQILTDADWVLWASLNDLLPLLAEAAPKEFLNNIDNALNYDPCPFDMIFSQERPGTIGATYITGLLWALESLAWDSEYFTHVVVILGELAARDPGGNWGNRPANSLTTILLPWHPQTCATISKRKIALETLMQEQPNVAWRLLLSLLPTSHQTSSGSFKPIWREMLSSECVKRVTIQEYQEQVELFCNLALITARRDPEKLSDLIDRLNNLPLSIHEQILTYLKSDEISEFSDSKKYQLWIALNKVVKKNRKYSDAKWAIKSEQVEKIAAIAEQLKPESLQYGHKWLFSEKSFDFYDLSGDWKQQLEEQEKRREAAIKEIYELEGLSAVQTFSKIVESSWRVGISFGTIADTDVDSLILPDFLLIEEKAFEQLAGGFTRSRFFKFGWKWVDSLDPSNWKPEQIGQFFAYLPFIKETWERSSRLLGNDDSHYWTKTAANPYEIDHNPDIAVDHLIKNGRPYAALLCLTRNSVKDLQFDNKRVIQSLLAFATRSSEDVSNVDLHDIIEAIKKLQEDPNTNLEDLFKVEWNYLQLLDQYHDASPKLLGQQLAENPKFFCEVIRAIYRSKKEPTLPKEISEKEKALATNAYHLLSEWRTLPGCQKDGAFKEGALEQWLDAVKSECADTGHLEIALTMVGHVLIYAPCDPNGLWIHHSVAKVLNAKDAKNIREGFTNALFNSRGVYGFSAGKEEEKIALEYRRKAEDVESHGYHRLSDALKDLSDIYQREANVEEKKKLSDDFD